jgi:Xaa-Pro aminopeptidase
MKVEINPYEDVGIGAAQVDWEKRVDFERLRIGRLERVKRVLAEKNVDLLIVCRWENARYMTSFRFHYWPTFRFGSVQVVFGKNMEKPLLYSGDEIHVKARMPWISDYAKFAPSASMEDPVYVMNWLKEVKQEVSKYVEPKNVAIDIWNTPMVKAVPKVFPNAEILDGQEIMMEARMIKTEDEIKLLRIANAITARGMATAAELIHNKPGLRENEVLAAAFKEMYEEGAEWTQCQNIVASGPYTCPYRRFTSDRIIWPGDLVIVDIGAMYSGYFADFTRTWVAGNVSPTKEQKKVFMAAYQVLEDAIKAIKPGVTTWDIYRAGYEGKTFEEGYIGHGGFLGHGIGIAASEPPYITTFAKDNPIVLKPGMVLCIEPYAGKPGIGGVRLEQTVLVTEHGAEILSPYPFEESLFIK